MNEYRYGELTVGHEERFTVIITEQMLSDFKSITGDINPMHNDRDYAVKMNFSDKVAYGMLTASFISTLGGVYLPGKYCLIQYVESKFIQPVYIGDTLVISGVIEAKHDSVRQIEVKVLIMNQNNKKVLKGKLKVGVLDE